MRKVFGIILIKKKYLHHKTLSQVGKRKGGSHFWKGLMDVKNQFLEEGTLWSIVAIKQISGEIFGLVINL
jgi:hypothetical protein